MGQETTPQFPLELPHEARLGAEDYLVAGPNAAAHALVTSWPGWPDRIMVLVGEDGAGKSHLAAIWASQASARRAADAAEALDLAMAGAPAALLDDVDHADETTLFHLLNAARERGSSLLLTARSAPTQSWPRLPDLASRLRALPVARLGPPDETMVRAVLLKLLDDRQLRVETGVVEFVAQRVDRSLGAVRALVEALDRESLARGKAIGKRLAGDVLGRLAEESD